MAEEVVAAPPKKPKRKFHRSDSQYGRTKKEVDWDVVDQLLLAGCTGVQIAGHFGMHGDTLYRKVEEKYGMSFTAYSSQKYSHGESLLLSKQFEKALTGDNMMMIWLGKNRCKQSDTPVQDHINEKAFEKFDKVMGQLDSLQESKKKEQT